MEKHEVTQILQKAYKGDKDAADRLWKIVYEELQQIARRELRKERKDHTYSTNDLVHEAYRKLVDQKRANWQNRGHFFSQACIAMRRILVNYARGRMAEKRKVQRNKVPLEQAMTIAVERSEELVALDEALTQLAVKDERKAQVVNFRYFGGFTAKETAKMMGISERTVERDWKAARDYLYTALHTDEPSRKNAPSGQI